MKYVRLVFACVTGLALVAGILANPFIPSRTEDSYLNRENDISNDIPSLPVEGGLKESQRHDETELEELYYSGNPYGMENPYDAETVYNLERFYDVDNPFYMGNNFFGEPNDYGDNSDEDPILVSIADLPEGTIISESYGQPKTVDVSDDSSSSESDGTESETAVAEAGATSLPYWLVPPPADTIGNPFMTGIPAQLQSFPMFNPQSNHGEYDEDEERLAAELETEREEKAESLRNNNAVSEEHARHLQTMRFRRGLSRALHLRNKLGDSEQAHGNGIRASPNKENLVVNNHPNCRGGGGGGSGGTNGGNPVGDAVDAANDAVDAVENVADNLRLAGRRPGRRQRNNGRSVE